MKRRFWTKEEIGYLRQHYPNEPTRVICEQLGRSYSGVAGMAMKLGIQKSEAFRNDPVLSGRTSNGNRGGSTRFKPGHKAWNKGMKGLQIGGHETQFKPGRLPHNTKHDGAISVRDGYKYIRISKAVWVPLHRHVWEQKHGPIPEGMNLIFKDKNRMNCDLDNLELLSNKELMQRNTLHRYPADIVDTIRTTGVLNRYIRKYERENNRS